MLARSSGPYDDDEGKTAFMQSSKQNVYPTPICDLIEAVNDFQITAPVASFHLPVVTHTAEAQALSRPTRLGVEKFTHAPLNFRVFPETPYFLSEFQLQTGRKSTLGKGAMGSVQLGRWMTHPDKPLKALKRISKFQMWKDDNPVFHRSLCVFE
jgi:hypothetical protein